MGPLKKFPRGIRILAITLLFLVSFYLFCLSPKLKTMNRIKEDLRSIESELQKARDVASHVDIPREEEKRKWALVQAKVEAIPREAKFSVLMGALLKLARATHLADPTFSNIRRASSFKYNDPKIHTGDLLIRMSFYCEYRDLGYFFKGLDEMNLGVVVESLEARRRPPRIHVELQLRPIWRER